MQALSYFASGEECKGKISEVLQHIEENHLMPPLMVVQTLAESQYATLSDIKVGKIYYQTNSIILFNLHTCRYISLYLHVHVLQHN